MCVIVSIMISRDIHFPSTDLSFSFFIVKQYSIGYKFHLFYPFVCYEFTDCFQDLAIMSVLLHESKEIFKKH